MSLTEYQLMCKISELGNMARAAEVLHISPSAASHAISNLEQRIGFTLINRNRNGITLTDNGKTLLPRFQAILDSEDLLQQDISRINGLEKGHVRIGVFDSVCTNWIPSILDTFKALYPNITVTVFQSDYQQIETMLLNSALDIGFVSVPSSANFNTVTLIHDRLLCITPPDYTPENTTYITVNELQSLPLIIATRGIDQNVNAFLSQNHLSICPQYAIALESSAIALVEKGLGCSILTELIIQGHPGNYKVYPLQSNEFRTIAIATLKGKETLLSTQKMIEVIRFCVQKSEKNSTP